MQLRSGGSDAEFMTSKMSGVRKLSRRICALTERLDDEAASPRSTNDRFIVTVGCASGSLIGEAC
jgi:hypothetical protein